MGCMSGCVERLCGVIYESRCCRWLVVLGGFVVLLCGFYAFHPLAGGQASSANGAVWGSMIALLGVVLAFLKEFLHTWLFPPVFEIKATGCKPHWQEFETKNKNGQKGAPQKWFAIEVKNAGLSAAKDVRVYFNGIQSNRIPDFNAYQCLPVRQAFGEAPMEKEPLPRPVLVPRKARFLYSFCYVQKGVQEDWLHFKFGRMPVALAHVCCREGCWFKFEILVTTDTPYALGTRAKFKLSYDGVYEHELTIEKIA